MKFDGVSDVLWGALSMMVAIATLVGIDRHLWPHVTAILDAYLSR